MYHKPQTTQDKLTTRHVRVVVVLLVMLRVLMTMLTPVIGNEQPSLESTAEECTHTPSEAEGSFDIETSL